jgi:hypothetical protein
MTTAVNAVVQVEPFKLFHSINEGVSSYIEPVAPSSMSPSHQLATVNTLPGRSSKPAGMAQVSKWYIVPVYRTRPLLKILLLGNSL